MAATETVAEVTSETEDEPTSEGTEEVEEPETRTAAQTTDTVAGDTTPESPEEDPAFQAVVEQIESVAARKRAHPSAEAASAGAQAAAESPANEVPSKGAANQVAEMAQQQPQLFERALFKETLSQRIGEITPETLEEADEFKKSNELASVKGELISTVEQEKDKSQGSIEETTNEAPDTSTVEPKPVRPLEPPDVGSPPSGIGAERAAPKPKTEFEVSTPFRERSQTLDQHLAEEGITEEQLEDANEPEFSAALQAKGEAQTHAAHAPTEYRQHEQSVLSSARAETETLAQTELQTMHDDRSQQLDQVSDLQERTKEEDERKREEIASDIQQIYDETKQSVNDRLAQLEQEVYRTFDQGAEEARARFENYVADRMRAYKAERYSGPRGWGRWVRDRFRPLPPKVNEFYVKGRKDYLSAMDSVIDRVADVVETGLVETTERIAEGRRKISEYVESLPESLKAVGQEAASNIRSEFDELEQTVENTKGQLIDSLAQKYNEKLQQIDARIEELKAENRGLFERALGAVAGVIRTITQLKDMLLSVLGKAISAVGSIIRDPIGFLGNLVTGIKQGLGNFLSNIWTHLQAGLINWLTGALTEAGIRLPEQFDLAGIFSLVMQVLGLTYENIRARAVKVLGEETVSALEKAFEIFQVLVTEGIAGLWTYVQEKIGDLQAMVMDKIRELIATQVIEAGIKWIMGLLGPVGAFIKACTAIYDVVTFFLRRASEVASLVDAVMDSILAIAKGDVSGAAKLVEDALVRSVPTVIGFLANLLGLGGLPEKIRGVIAAVQEPISRGIQWVIEQARAAARRLGSALGIGKEEKSSTTDSGTTVPVEGVKALVKADLAPLLPKVTSREELKTILSTMVTRYRDEGLQRLYLVHDEERPGVFEVHAVASLGEQVGAAELVQTIILPDFEFGWPKTVAYARFEGAEFGPMRNEQLVKKSEPAEEHSLHAETLALAWLEGQWLVRDKQKDPGPYKLEISISRSPCKRCAKDLDNFVRDKKEEGYKINSTIRFASLYGGKRSPREKAQLKWLRKRGHTLEVWDILAELEYFYGPGITAEMVTDKQRAELTRRITEVRDWLDQTEAETDIRR